MFKLVYWLLIFTPRVLFCLTTLNVTLDTDNNPGGFGDPGDLRYYLNTMNQDLNTTPDDYAIIFDFPMTIQLNGNLPIINNSSNPVNITIGNPGSIPTVTIDGNSGAYSGFFMPMGNVTIQNIIFQNLTAKGGNGGDGISGGGGGMGAGGAIYAPESFLNGSNPAITLSNVSINNCSAIGGNGGNYLGGSSTGNEGGGGGGGFGGNGGSIITTGTTGGAGGGGFGGNGGDVTLAAESLGGGGGGGGGIGSLATMGTPTNLGDGGSDQDPGQNGNGYGLTFTAGSGGAGINGGNNAGGGGGGNDAGGVLSGGGGGGSAGSNGLQPQGSIPPGGSATPSGGNGGDGGGGGGAGIVVTNITNNIDGQAGNGGYAGGGGGGAGTGASDANYTVQGGSGGMGGGGGGGGVDQSGMTPATGGNSLGGGGGAGGGPSNSSQGLGGVDTGNLGGGSGGSGASSYGFGFGGGGGGGGSGLGGAIFVDSNLNFTIQAFSSIPTVFNTTNNSTQAGMAGTAGSGGGSDGTPGSALGNSIFLRSSSTLTLVAENADDLLTLGDQVAFIDDTTFGGTGTNVFVRGDGTVIYNGTTDYAGSIIINNANFKVNGVINTAPISVCRDISFSPQRGTLSGIGTVTGNVLANSGVISPDNTGTLTLGSLFLNPADLPNNVPGSLVHINIDFNNTSLVAVNGPATLAGTLEVDLGSNAQPGAYTILTSSGITGVFDSVTFTGTTPHYTLSYLPDGSPTFVQLNFLGYPCTIAVNIEPESLVIQETETILLTAQASGCNPPYTYSWTGPNGFSASSATITIPDASQINTGIYTVTVTDSLGNTGTASASVVVLPAEQLSVEIVPSESRIHAGDTVILTALAQQGVPPYSYFWTGPDDFLPLLTRATADTQSIIIPTVTSASAGLYTVTVTDFIGTTARADFILHLERRSALSSAIAAKYCNNSLPAIL